MVIVKNVIIVVFECVEMSILICKKTVNGLNTIESHCMMSLHSGGKSIRDDLYEYFRGQTMKPFLKNGTLKMPTFGFSC